MNTTGARPGVIFWYRIYCGVTAFFYLAIAVTGIAGMIFDPTFPKDVDHPEAFMIFFYVFCAILLALGGAFIGAFFLKRTPGAWNYHLVMICLGIANGCFLPFGIILLIFWLRPEIKEYFQPSLVGSPS